MDSVHNGRVIIHFGQAVESENQNFTTEQQSWTYGFKTILTDDTFFFRAAEQAACQR